MNWFTKTFTSSIGRKVVMSLTGLFLCSFLVVHLVGNLQLFKNDDGVAFNTYSHFMGHNPLIRTLEWGLVLGFGFHIYEAIALTLKNRKARSHGYDQWQARQNSDWTSRNMGILGSIILVFLLIHLFNFFWKARFGIMALDKNKNDDLYQVVVGSFHVWWYVALYVAAQASIGYHLWHGFRSAFQTLGLNHRKYTPLIKAVGYTFAVVVSAGFAAMPLYFFFFTNERGALTEAVALTVKHLTLAFN